jgi:hypothetical protein
MTTRSTDHTIAISREFSDIHEPPCHPGFMKSSRMAEVVTESGFH